MGLATRSVPGENMRLHRKQNPMGLLDAYFFAVKYWQSRPSRLEGAASGTCYESGNLKGYAAILPIQKSSIREQVDLKTAASFAYETRDTARPF